MNQLFPLSWIGIEESETKILIKKDLVSPSIKKNDFQLALALLSK